ncbi:glycosyltransferase [Mariniphaga sediminis]|uniref:Glycosyltransferase n=1 Tax=Mariniphaga sediminis TaxID=1628158 RepID=A0A399D0C8_9BACT|nr:glycosyltransferase [Mariniphaga sediminis]RIH64916.1 glycosyltransferase [Mariniphaga sediminis]
MILRNSNVNPEAKKRIIVSVTNDLVSDNRVHKVCTTLVAMGFDVLLVGRKLQNSVAVTQRTYSIHRFNLLFNKGVLFYACFNCRLFLFLLFGKFDLLLSNDLDTLPANFLASKIKGKPLVYDSHEYFTEVPELVHRPRIRRIWEWLERKMVPKLKYAYTVCDSIANIYTEKYGVHFRVVRNVPVAANFKKEKESNRGMEQKMILYQGAVNMGRGLIQAIRAMKFIEGARLVIAGDGDIRTELEKLVETEKLRDKVQFLGRLPIAELALLTPQADIGLSIEEDLGLNYRYSLPNKLFDYIQSRVPVLVTNLPETTAIVRKYGVGEVTPSLNPEILAGLFSAMLTDTEKRITWQQNLEKAAAELTWENEEKIIQEIFSVFV